jgi:hypothetical protein
MTTKNAVFWDIRTLFVPHRRHITSHGGDYEEYRLLGYRSLFVPHRRNITSHGGDYEEYRFLGYKNPVRISQETHYLIATEDSQLTLCKI